MNVSQKHIPEFKVILVGDADVGKTSIIMRFQHNVFMKNIQNTIGGSYITKIIETSKGQANLNIWDTAGQEKYRSLVPMYTRNAAAAIIVFDVSDPIGFDSAQTWIQEIKQQAPEDCQIFVVGNKIDQLADGKLPPAILEDIKNLCNKNNCFLEFVSAFSGEGVQDLFKHVADSIPSGRYQATTELIPETNDTPKSSCC